MGAAAWVGIGGYPPPLPYSHNLMLPPSPPPGLLELWHASIVCPGCEGKGGDGLGGRGPACPHMRLPDPAREPWPLPIVPPPYGARYVCTHAHARTPTHTYTPDWGERGEVGKGGRGWKEGRVCGGCGGCEGCEVGGGERGRARGRGTRTPPHTQPHAGWAMGAKGARGARGGGRGSGWGGV